MAEQTPDAAQYFKDFAQIGAVVEDIDQSIKVLTEVFGIGPWRVIEWPPAARTDMVKYYYDRPGDFTARMAFAALGPIELELIQPLTGASIWRDFLADHGPGLHHIRFNVDELEPTREALATLGIATTQWGSGIRPGTSWANFDTERLIGFTIEIMRKVPGTDGRTPAVVDGRPQE